MIRNLVFYNSNEERLDILNRLIENAKFMKIGILSAELPIIGNLNVEENIMLPMSFHYGTSQTEAEEIILEELAKQNLEDIINLRPNQLNDYKKFVVKYLQIKLLRPEWIAVMSVRRLVTAEFEDRVYEFLRCTDVEKKVIIDHERNRHMFEDIEGYTEIGFEEWATNNLKM